LTEEVLQNDIGIEKVGYRSRILIKLKSESLSHIEALSFEK
jgi:hypothetical protein